MHIKKYEKNYVYQIKNKAYVKGGVLEAIATYIPGNQSTISIWSPETIIA